MGFNRTILIVIALIAPVFFCVSCSKSNSTDKPSADVTNSAPGVSQATPVATDPLLTNKLEQLAVRIEESLSEGDVEAFKKCFDLDALIQEVVRGAKISGRDFEQFKSGLKRGLYSGLESIATNWANSQVKFKGIVKAQDRPAVRFRVIEEEGTIAFVDLIAAPGKGTNYNVANIYNQNFGFDMAAQVRQNALPILSELDKTLVQRLLNKPQVPVSDLEEFGKFTKSYAQGQYAETIQRFASLPDALKTTLPAQVTYIGALQKSEDMDGYREALKQAAAWFTNASFSFMLVDVHVLEKDYPKATQCLDTYYKVVGPDAALLALKSSITLLSGETAAAKTLLAEAFELEPDSEYVHSCGLDVLLAARDFGAVAQSMRFLQENHGYDWKGNLTDDVWKEFLSAPESAPWR